MTKEIQHKKNHIVFLGETSFPFGLGAVQRMILMAKSLLSAGADVTVLCRKGVWIKKEYAGFPRKGSFEGIRYAYTSKNVMRPSSFFTRNLDKIIGMYGEFKYLKQLKKQGNLTAAIVSNHRVIHILRYRIYAWLLGFPMILNYVELASSIESRAAILTRINDYIYDYFILKIMDGALPISSKLAEQFRTVSGNKPYLKVPILCDFNTFNDKGRRNHETVLLYCGAASYYELVEFIIDAFDSLHFPNDNIFLQLILGGSEDQLGQVVQRIETSKNHARIRLLTNVIHSEIPEHYTNASALLIPMRPTPQDEARFPHKIGEYLASARPIITTAVGEIMHYDFIDEETALIAKEYTTGSFASKMEFILKHPEKAEEIGRKGRIMGLKHFNYSGHGLRMMEYIQSFSPRSKT